MVWWGAMKGFEDVPEKSLNALEIKAELEEVAEKLLADIGELGFISQALSDGE